MSSKKRNIELSKMARNHRVADSVTESVIFNFLSSLDTPRSLTVWLLYSNKEHGQLVELDVSPFSYTDGKRFRDDYIATQFLSKSSFLKLEVSKKEAAMRKFFEYEELCKRTNRRFQNFSNDPLFTGLNASLLFAMQRKIEKILGTYLPDEFVDCANWGPGVSTLLKGSHVSAVNKYQSETGITRNLYSFVEPWFSEAYPLWNEHITESGTKDFGDFFSMQAGNVIVTVPKNSKTDRVIAIEPGFNQFWQKSIGLMIRRRLSRYGIDLNSQERNQQLAYESSIDDSLATVDFSSASDSIALALVREIIPSRWLRVMELTRSQIGVHNKVHIKWEKFSSMGNGFTFELESLIFFAAASAVCEHLSEPLDRVSVFGDDVILPSSCYALYSSFCEFLGFKVNKTKSFSSSYFRESCGSHFYDGLSCKPLFLKERLQNVQAIYKLANGVRALAHRYGNYRSCDLRFRTCWYHLFQRAPKPLRFRIPLGIGDGGFVVNFDEATPVLPRHGYCGYLCQGLVETGLTQYSEGLGLLLTRVRGGSEREYGNYYTLRGRTRIKTAMILVPAWYNLGSWSN